MTRDIDQDFPITRKGFKWYFRGHGYWRKANAEEARVDYLIYTFAPNNKATFTKGGRVLVTEIEPPQEIVNWRGVPLVSLTARQLEEALSDCQKRIRDYERDPHAIWQGWLYESMRDSEKALLIEIKKRSHSL